MARFSFTLFAFLAMLCIVFAQSSSTGDILVGSSTGVPTPVSSSAAAAGSSTGLPTQQSSSAVITDPDSSSSTSIAASSSVVIDVSSTGAIADSSSGIILDSSSSGMEGSSSSGMVLTSSSSFNPLPFVPANWADIEIAGNGTVFNVTWGNKTEDNLMFGIGSPDGFIIDNFSGRTLRLVQGFYYTLMVDAAAAAQGLYVTFDPRGNEIAGSNISFIGTPITTPGTYNFSIAIPSSEENIFVYYASNQNQFAGGAIVVGRQSAAALQASFVVMAISAFVALLFPKW